MQRVLHRGLRRAAQRRRRRRQRTNAGLATGQEELPPPDGGLGRGRGGGRCSQHGSGRRCRRRLQDGQPRVRRCAGDFSRRGLGALLHLVRVARPHGRARTHPRSVGWEIVRLPRSVMHVRTLRTVSHPTLCARDAATTGMVASVPLQRRHTGVGARAIQLGVPVHLRREVHLQRRTARARGRRRVHVASSQLHAFLGDQSRNRSVRYAHARWLDDGGDYFGASANELPRQRRHHVSDRLHLKFPPGQSLSRTARASSASSCTSAGARSTFGGGATSASATVLRTPRGLHPSHDVEHLVGDHQTRHRSVVCHNVDVIRVGSETDAAVHLRRQRVRVRVHNRTKATYVALIHVQRVRKRVPVHRRSP
jgi:hypothetical protein